MTDTTIPTRRNPHKISTGILVAFAVLATIGGTAACFLKPTGVIAFAPISFGTEQLANALPAQVAANQLTPPKQHIARAEETPPLPQRSPIASVRQ